jgi:hypothetical protein
MRWTGPRRLKLLMPTGSDGDLPATCVGWDHESQRFSVPIAGIALRFIPAYTYTITPGLQP